jgi:hypothetical protein
MDSSKRWRFEANNPKASKEWKPLFDVSEEELAASLQLRDELNKVNSPVVLRIVDKESEQTFD